MGYAALDIEGKQGTGHIRIEIPHLFVAHSTTMTL